ncbi:MAG: hypothetical protein ACRECH_07685 [Nitrososphaerales archaeon]
MASSYITERIEETLLASQEINGKTPKALERAQSALNQLILRVEA